MKICYRSMTKSTGGANDIHEEVSYHEDFEESQAVGASHKKNSLIGQGSLRLNESPIRMEPQIVSARGIANDSTSNNIIEEI